MMGATTEDRVRLESRLGEVLGLEEAATLLGYLPLVDPADLATKQDVDALRAEMRTGFAQVDARFAQVDARSDARFAQVDARFAQVDARFDEVREDFHRLELGMSELKVDLRDALLSAVARANRTTMLAMAGTITGSSVLALSILRLTG
jgi:chromosome segregation ATPase